jgi:putative hydrolase of the HAD superfamily
VKYTAVIFDLFGTLIDNISSREYETALVEMASVLSASLDDFVRLWYKISEERINGTIQSPEGAIDHVCRILGVHPEDAQINLAAQIRFDMTKRKIMRPRTDAVEILSRLKSEGYKTGLISNCSTETATLWKDTPFAPLIDVALFSCSVGLRKPNSDIYQLTVEQLEVEPQACLYIDDIGISGAGAAKIGMHPVLIRDPNEDRANVYPANAESDKWNGPVISSLKEVLTLVK